MKLSASLLWLWAARDLLRRPAEALLAGGALAAFVWIIGAALLLTRAVEGTAQRMVKAGPSLVMRRLDASGFSPLPLSVTASVAQVPGALNVRPRVWGPARAGAEPVEVFAVDAQVSAALQQADLPIPDDDTAVVGPGFAHKVRAYVTVVGPGGQATLQMIGALPQTAGLVAQDTFLVSPAVARRVLGIPEGFATDLVLDVNRESEEDAIRPDLADAVPFVSVISAQHEAVGRVAVNLGRRGGLFLLLCVPAGLALLVLVAGVARDRAARSKEVGVLKAVGWTTSNVLTLHLFRALWVAAPALGLGLAGAWLSVFGPWVQWPGALLFGWSGVPPHLYLDPAGAGMVLVEVSATVLLPWLAASLWPAVLASAKDPWSLISAEGE